jgi:isopenicillin N synthase-like dioxygenase
MSYAEGRQIDVADIPVIDVAPLVSGDRGGAAQVAAAMLTAAEDIGFFYVRNHGIREDLIAQVDATARAFFARPLAEKEALAPQDRHRGFLGVGQAKMYEQAKVDLKESFIWGLDVGADDPDYRAGNRMIGPNRWPASMPGMRETLNAFFDAANACGQALLRGFALSLGVAEDTFVARFAKPVTRCTLVYYPPQPPDLGVEQFGVAPHTDYGVITLVHQDDVGGLQVWARNREWVTAHPIPGTLVVNVGDLLARWTNDRFRSTPHRVVNASGRARVSIAAFVDPDHDTPIAPVCAAGEAPHFPPTTCGEYILGRFDKSFAYRQR